MARVLVPAAGLVVAGCQATGGGGGGGGGDDGAQTGDAEAGQATYNQVCAQCHGTPGANDGDAPDLAGTSAAAMEAEVTGDDHGGGRIEGFLDRHYQEMAAYLAGGRDGGDDEGGGDGGDDEGGGDGGDDEGGGDGGDDGGGADVGTACDFATAADIASVRQSVQNDYMMGYSREDELSLMAQGCQSNPTVPYNDCMACGTAIVDEVYP